MSTGILESSEYLDRMKILRALAAKHERLAEQELVNEKLEKSQQITSYCISMLNAVSYKIAESETALHEFKIRNQQVLNMGRKSLYEVLIRLESLVSNQVDISLREVLAHQKTIEAIDDILRYTLVRKLFIAIDHLKIAYGENTKWKWTFVELMSRAAIIGRNFLNLKRVSAGLQPGSSGYKECSTHLRFVLDKLQDTATGYHSKFELAGKQLIDMQQAMRLLNAARQLVVVFGDREQADDIKRRLSVWKQKLETEVKRK